MATGQKISAQTVATSFDSTDLATIVQSGVNKSITHDVFMDDTQICKAWVNFNGTGVVAIRDDFNVSSITDSGTGNYIVNLTNALTDTNGSVVLGVRRSIASIADGIILGFISATTTIKIDTTDTAPTATDMEVVCCAIFGS